MEPKADIALIGLAVMGQNLILNMNDHGFTVVAYNRTTSKVDDFLANEAIQSIGQKFVTILKSFWTDRCCTIVYDNRQNNRWFASFFQILY